MQVSISVKCRDIADVEQFLTTLRQLEVPRELVDEVDGTFQLHLKDDDADYIVYVLQVAAECGGRQMPTFDQWRSRDELRDAPVQTDFIAQKQRGDFDADSLGL